MISAFRKFSSVEDKRGHDRQLFNISDNFLVVPVGSDAEIAVIDIDPAAIGGISLKDIPDDRISFVLRHNGQEVSGSMDASIKRQGTVTLRQKTYHKYLIQLDLDNIDPHKDSFYISPRFQPHAYCDHPINLDEKVCFKVVGFEKNGFILGTSLRNKGFFRGAKLSLFVLMPFSGEHHIHGIISRVSLQSTEMLIEVKYLPGCEKFLSASSDYLLGFCGSQPDVRQLKESGFLINESGLGLRIKDVKTLEEWEEVLKIRKIAYQEVNKMMGVKNHYEAEDEFDAFSRKFMVTLNEKIIGSFRIVYVNGDVTKSEHHKLNITIPEWLVKGGFAELSRICVLPDYQSRDVFFAILRMASLSLVSEPTVSYMLGNCNPKEWIVYQYLGARKLGEPFAAFGRNDCQLLYVDINRAIAGRLMTPNINSLAIYAHIGEPVRKKLGLMFLGIKGNFIAVAWEKLRKIFSKYWLWKKINEYRKTGKIK